MSDERINPQEVFTRLSQASNEAAQAEYESKIAKAAMETVYATIADDFMREETVERSKIKAKYDERYLKAQELYIEKSMVAQLAKGKDSAARAWWECTRSVESTRRAEMQIR